MIAHGHTTINSDGEAVGMAAMEGEEEGQGGSHRLSSLGGGGGGDTHA